jgi:uncharacterized protein (TIGR02217 family)
MAFHDVRLPIALALGASGGPERRTEIVTLASGAEERNSPWAGSRRRWDVGAALRTLDDLAAVTAFFEARRGRLHAFRFRDPADCQSCLPSRNPAATDQPIGIGDGLRKTYALTKTYADAGGSWTRAITRPVAGTVLVAVNGAAVAFGAGLTLDSATGVLTFAVAPAAGATITAGYRFDVPARFDTDRLELSVDGFLAGRIVSIPIVEVLA